MRISPVYNNVYKQIFKANYSKDNNVVILGSSKTSDSIMDSLVKCSMVTRQLLSQGKNIVTGCGSHGIMGQAYYTAVQCSSKDKFNRPEQNLAIVKEPLWGDEDLENCVVLGCAKSEGQRIEKFIETADSFIIFPGGPATLQEAVTLISNNHYATNKKKVFLVGEKFFKGLDKQYKQMKQAGLIKCELSELYIITDDVDKIINKMND